MTVDPLPTLMIFWPGIDGPGSCLSNTLDTWPDKPAACNRVIICCCPGVDPLPEGCTNINFSSWWEVLLAGNWLDLLAGNWPDLLAGNGPDLLWLTVSAKLVEAKVLRDRF